MSEKHTKTISVEGTEITILQIDDTDYICITDMLKAKDGDFVVKDWLRNRNTLEFLGIWEKVYNPDFNWGEFALIRNQAGLNRFRISVKEYVRKPMLSASKPEPGAMAEPTLTKTSLLSLLCGSARNLKYIWCATFSG